MFSYGENNTINFDTNPITQLVGLNGHGKSSIPLIVEEVLYNKNSKGIKKGDIVNRYSNDNKYSASLNMSVFNDQYSINISRSGATQKVKLIKNGEDISSHTATDTFKQIESIIGMDFKTFSQLVYQNGNASLQFLTATDTARKNFLISLLSLEKYVKIFEQVKELHKGVNDTLISTRAKVDTVTSWLDKHGNVSLEPLPIVEEPEDDTSTYRESLAGLKVELGSLEAEQNKILTNNKYKAARDSIDKSVLEYKPEVPKVVDPKLSDTVAVLKHSASDLQSRIKKYSSVKSGVCHSCFQEIDENVVKQLRIKAERELEEVSNSLEKVTKELARATDEFNQASTRVRLYEKTVSEFEKYSSLIDESLPTIIRDANSIKQEIAELTSTLSRREAELRDIRSKNDAAKVQNAKIEALQEQNAQYLAQLETLQPVLENLQKDVGLLEALKKAFSTNGLVAYKIENSVKVLEQLTNGYLATLSDGRFQLQFSLVNDKLNVVIVDDGKSIDISALSAGELARVNTSTLLAIRKLMSDLSKCKINILFLDETIDNLDAFGKERLVDVLLEEDLNTFLVSHSYSHPLVTKLSVIKEEGFSRIETDG